MQRFFLFLLWIPIASSAQIRVDSKGEKLNGRIKKMVEYQYSLFADSNQGRVPDQTAIYTYDEEARQANVYYYWNSDSTRCVYREILKYKGNKLSEHRRVSKVSAHGGFIEGDSTSSVITYIYNDSDRLIETRSSQFGVESKTSYLYDNEGNVIETSEYSNAISLSGQPDKRKSTFKYDNTGHVVQENSYILSRVYHSTYKYDSNFHFSEKHKIDTMCDREWKTISRYDNGMNLIEEV